MNLVETTRHNQLSQVNIKEGQQCQLQSCLASSRVLEWNFQSPTKELVERHKMMNTEPLDCQVCYGFLLQRKQVACRGGHQILCLEHVHLRRRSWESFPNLYQPIFWFLGTIRDFYLSLSLSIFAYIYIYVYIYRYIGTNTTNDRNRSPSVFFFLGLANPLRKKVHVLLKWILQYQNCFSGIDLSGPVKSPKHPKSVGFTSRRFSTVSPPGWFQMAMKMLKRGWFDIRQGRHETLKDKSQDFE